MTLINIYGQYYVTEEGDVYSFNYKQTGKIQKLIPKKDGHGYLCVALCKEGKVVYKKIHRLVAQAFIPNPENKRTINHINGVRSDNRVENLEWATDSENNKHAFKHLGRKPSMLGKLGKNCPNSKIVLQISNDKVIREFFGTNEASRATGIAQPSISRCCTGGLKTAGGYQWRYKNS